LNQGHCSKENGLNSVEVFELYSNASSLVSISKIYCPLKQSAPFLPRISMPKIQRKHRNDTNDHNVGAYADPNRGNISWGLVFPHNKAACNPTKTITRCSESRSQNYFSLGGIERTPPNSKKASPRYSSNILE
jgi:hypothetical protein